MILKYVICENIEDMNDFQVECYIDNDQLEDCSIFTVRQAIHTLIDKEYDYRVLEEIIGNLIQSLGKNESIEKRILETSCVIKL